MKLSHLHVREAFFVKDAVPPRIALSALRLVLLRSIQTGSMFSSNASSVANEMSLLISISISSTSDEKRSFSTSTANMGDIVLRWFPRSSAIEVRVPFVMLERCLALRQTVLRSLRQASIVGPVEEYRSATMSQKHLVHRRRRIKILRKYSRKRERGCGRLDLIPRLQWLVASSNSSVRSSDFRDIDHSMSVVSFSPVRHYPRPFQSKMLRCRTEQCLNGIKTTLKHLGC